MSLGAKDHKDVRGAYKERQKAMYMKDYRKGKSAGRTSPKPWKMSKGHGTRSGRVTAPGRNYGCREWERAWWPAWAEAQDIGDGDDDGDVETDKRERQMVRDSPLSYRTEEPVFDVKSAVAGESEQGWDSYELELAQALSLSLMTAEASLDDDGDVEYESEQEAFDGDADGYSFLDTDSDAMDTVSECETDASDETDWVDVNEAGVPSERPTYAQMTKVEVT